MKRIHHIFAMVLLTALFAFSLVCYGKDAEGSAEASVTQREIAEHPAVIALRDFTAAVASQDIDKIFDYVLAPAEAVQAMKEMARMAKEDDPAKFSKMLETRFPTFGIIESVEEQWEDEVLIVCEAKVEGENRRWDVTMIKADGRWFVEDAEPHKSPEEKSLDICAMNLKIAGLGFAVYSNDHNDRLPNSLDELDDDYLPLETSCTGGDTPVPYVLQPEVAGKSISDFECPRIMPLVICKNHKNAEVVAYVDGHVEIHKYPDAETDKSAPPASSTAEHPAVVALRDFFQTVADKDGEKAASFWAVPEWDRKDLAESVNHGSFPFVLQEVVSEQTEGDSSFIVVKMIVKLGDVLGEIEMAGIFSMVKVDGEWKIMSIVPVDDGEEMDALPVAETSASAAVSPPAADSEVVATLKDFFQAVADKDEEKIAGFFVSNHGEAEFVAKRLLELQEFVSEQRDGDSSVVIAKVNMENDENTTVFLLKIDGKWRIQDMRMGRDEGKNNSVPVGESEAVVALKDFLQAVSNKDGKKVADFLPPLSATSAELRALIEGVNDGMISWKLLGIASERTEGDRSTIVARIHYQFNNVPFPFYMSKINGEWKISLGP